MTADTSKLVWSLEEKEAANGGVCYKMHYDVILLFGLTEVTAQISWVHEVHLVVVLNKLYCLHCVQGVEKG